MRAFTRQDAIECLQEYARVYGRDFAAAAFNPATARWQRHPEYIERYHKGRPDGRPWMSLNAIKKLFPTPDKPGGSWDEARRAAGLPVNSTGPRRRRPQIPAESELPAPRQVVVRHVDRSRELSAEVARLRDQLVRSQARVEQLTGELRKSKSIEKTVTVAKADDDAIALAYELLADANREVAELISQRELLRESAAAATREIQDKLAELAERSALIEQLRAADRERREAMTALARRAEEDERVIRELMTTSEQLSAQVCDQRDELAMLRADLEQARAKSQEAVQRAAADALVSQATQRAERAEKAAQRAERVAMSHARAATGELRVLTPSELRELVDGGPAGPAIFKAAVVQVAKAQSTGGQALARALTEAMRAAATWKARL